MEVSGAGVVPGALPGFEDVGTVRTRQGLQRREAEKESFVVREGLHDPGLLEQDFRDPDAVRVPVATPGKGPPMFAEPGQERRGDRRGYLGTGPGTVGGTHE
ncbi:MAG: hypothetical protein L3K10_01655 [Thermoplasmata archaeon]|nr:hypothetical protein [Thermoplasmata archaeon]